jgi:hypothetical protein
VVTLPVNRWLIARGKGHAVVHDVHGSSDLHGGHGTDEGHAGRGGRLTARR